MVEKKWKVLSKKHVFKSKYVQIYQNKVRFPSGYVVNDYVTVTMPDYVKIVAMDKNNRVMIMREYRLGFGDYTWEICAGFIDKGESPIEAAKRELKEETGYTKGNFKVIGFAASDPGTNTHRGYIVLATNVRGRKKQKLEPTESITGIKFVPLKQIRKMVARNDFISSSVLAAFALSGILKD